MLPSDELSVASKLTPLATRDF